jgi:nicotinamide mononucleotide transporter
LNFALLSDQIAQQDWVEWIGLITGIAYVILATYERPSCWIFGIISSACIAWKSFTDYFLIADGLLQAFYIIIGVVGLWQWIKGKSEGHQKPIVTYPVSNHIMSIGVCLLVSFPISWLLITYADARYGYLDTLLTLLSVWATWLLIQKELNNWVYWIIIDAVYVALYWGSEGYLFALLFLVYALISVFGWNRWRKEIRNKVPVDINKIM